MWSHTGLPGLLRPLKQLMNFFPATPLTSLKSFFFALLLLLDSVLPVTNGLAWKEPECQYTWPRLGDPWCLTCVSICCTGSLHMLGNGNFLDRIFNHAFASPPCHKRSFSLPAMYLPTYPFRLWITKITVTKILGWDVYQDVSLLSCLATLNVLSAYAVISLSKIPLTQTEYVKTFPGKVSCYDLSFCPSWNLNTAEMEISSWYAMKQETRLVGDMKQWWRCCKTPGSPVSLLMKV